MNSATFLRLLGPIAWPIILYFGLNIHDVTTQLTKASLGITLFVSSMATGNYVVYSNAAHLSLGFFSICTSRCLAYFVHNMTIPSQPTNEIYIPVIVVVEIILSIGRVVVFYTFLQNYSVVVSTPYYLFLTSIECLFTYITHWDLLSRHWKQVNLGTMVTPTLNAKAFNWLYFLNITGVFHPMSAMLSLMSALLLLRGHVNLNLHTLVQQKLTYIEECKRHVGTNRKMLIHYADKLDTTSTAIDQTYITIVLFVALYAITKCVSILPKFVLPYSSVDDSDLMPIYEADDSITKLELHTRLRRQFATHINAASLIGSIGYIVIHALTIGFSVATRDWLSTTLLVLALWAVSALHVRHLHGLRDWTDKMKTTSPVSNRYFQQKAVKQLYDSVLLFSEAHAALACIACVFAVVCHEYL